MAAALAGLESVRAGRVVVSAECFGEPDFDGAGADDADGGCDRGPVFEEAGGAGLGLRLKGLLLVVDGRYSIAAASARS